MGVVHRAEQETLKRTVALKIPKHPQLNHRFKEEALISGYLNHPNIISVIIERKQTNGSYHAFNRWCLVDQTSFRLRSVQWQPISSHTS